MKKLFALFAVLVTSLPALATPQFECVSAIGAHGPGSAFGKLYQGPTLNQIYTGAPGTDARVPGYDLRYYMAEGSKGVLQLHAGSDLLILDSASAGTISSNGYLGLINISLLGPRNPSTCVLDVWAIACGQTAAQAQAGLSDLIGVRPVNPSADLPSGCTNGQ